MSDTWNEIISAREENRHEIILSGPVISERIKTSGLDRTLFNLTALNYINISETCLSIISDDLGKLVNLQTLVLHTNKLEKLPITLSKLTKLKNLDVSRNVLKTLPNEISVLHQLASLNVSSNCLTSIPCLSQNVKLSILDVANNALTEFPDICYPDLVHLAEVKLNKNKIVSIPANIKALSALKIFDLSSNEIKIIPNEVSECNKLKEINLKENPIADKRLLKLVDQCRSKQVLDYVKQHCPRVGNGESVPGGGKKGKKGQGKKTDAEQRKSESEQTIVDLTHKMSVLHVNDLIPNVKTHEKIKTIRPFIVCCIVQRLKFDEISFKKFIQMQTKLHDTCCDKRNAATIATHDLSKLAPGDLLYTAQAPGQLKIQPLMRNKLYSGAQLFNQLQTEADNLRREKKRNVYSGIHRYLYLLEGKPLYPCLLDSKEQVISFPPITNSDITKMSVDTTSIFIEVTSATSQNVCRKVMDTLLYEILILGVGDAADKSSGEDIKVSNQFHTLTVQQVKIIDLEGNLKAVYPSRTDLDYEDRNISVLRE